MMLDTLEAVEISDSLKPFGERTCLVVEDDDAYRQRLSLALTRTGFIVSSVRTIADALTVADKNPPAFAVVDLRLQDGSGLEVVEALQNSRPDIRSIILTGYGTLPLAVSAMKLGAQNVLTKPADIEDIVSSLTTTPGEMPAPPENPTSPDQVRWEHIKAVFERSNHNVSETARRLNMHRRTLQRILLKMSPR